MIRMFQTTYNCKSNGARKDVLLSKYYVPFDFRAASIAASVGDGKKKEQRFVIWPEWSDAEINAEKWVRT